MVRWPAERWAGGGGDLEADIGAGRDVGAAVQTRDLVVAIGEKGVVVGGAVGGVVKGDQRSSGRHKDDIGRVNDIVEGRVEVGEDAAGDLAGGAGEGGGWAHIQGSADGMIAEVDGAINTGDTAIGAGLGAVVLAVRAEIGIGGVEAVGLDAAPVELDRIDSDEGCAIERQVAGGNGHNAGERGREKRDGHITGRIDGRGEGATKRDVVRAVGQAA